MIEFGGQEECILVSFAPNTPIETKIGLAISVAHGWNKLAVFHVGELGLLIKVRDCSNPEDILNMYKLSKFGASLDTEIGPHPSFSKQDLANLSNIFQIEAEIEASTNPR